jgi:hypothetical protein
LGSTAVSEVFSVEIKSNVTVSAREFSETFARFRSEPVQTTYTIAGRGRTKRARELPITGGRGLKRRV